MTAVFWVFCLGVVISLFGCASATTDAANRYRPALQALELEALLPTYSADQVNALLKGQLADSPPQERRAAAVLVSLGAIAAADLTEVARTAQKLNDFVAVLQNPHPALAGKLGDASLLARLDQPLDYSPLLAAAGMREELGDALESGVITGYDVRAKGVYDGFPAGHTLIYSHSDPVHLRQLVTLLAREGVEGWVYLTPKVSAFLYREGWGGSGANVVTLAGGLRVVQGREMAVLFRFPNAAERRHFHEVVTRFAKRDTEDQAGLIAGSWWQPFYYADEPLPGFLTISLVVLTAGGVETTLTVLDKKAAAVMDTFRGSSWAIRRDQVWVNPAFHRFLNGDYK